MSIVVSINRSVFKMDAVVMEKGMVDIKGLFSVMVLSVATEELQDYLLFVDAISLQFISLRVA